MSLNQTSTSLFLAMPFLISCATKNCVSSHSECFSEAHFWIQDTKSIVSVTVTDAHIFYYQKYLFENQIVEGISCAHITNRDLFIEKLRASEIHFNEWISVIP